CVALDIERGLAELRLGLRQLRLGLIERRHEWPRIDLEEHVARPDRFTLAIVLLDDVSGDSRLDLRVDVPVQHRDPVVVNGRVALYDRGNFYAWRRRSRWRRAAATAAPGGNQHGATQHCLRGRMRDQASDRHRI